MKKPKKQCEIGLKSNKIERAAVRRWKKATSKPKTKAPGAIGSVSQSVEAPPAPGTPAYKCMPKWMLYFQQAQNIDLLNQWIIKLQGWLLIAKAVKPPQPALVADIEREILKYKEELRVQTVTFPAVRSAYLECVKGYFV